MRQEYTNKEKLEIYQAIEPLHKKGMLLQDIADHLNKHGPKPKNTEAWSAGNICSMAKNAGFHRNAIKEKKGTPTKLTYAKEYNSDDLLLEIVSLQHATPKIKAAMLKSVIESL